MGDGWTGRVTPRILPLPVTLARTRILSVSDWTFEPDAVAALFAAAAPADARRFRLRRMAEELALAPGFDRLITLDHNTIRELPHQIDVAMRVLRPPMRGRAILADEVGLGKTIEAGIILKELAVRGLARRIVILTPASLVGQWQAELETKFFEHFDTPHSPAEWRDATRAIVSLDRARRARQRSAITRQPWDLVIVDEAHKVRNHRTATHALLQEIERNFILLLTATPLQNDLRELYNLITLLRPGHFGTWREFRQRFLVRGNRREPKDPELLRDLTRDVMIRTRRASVAHELALPARRPEHPRITLTPAEHELYAATVTFVRRLYRTGFLAPDADDRRRTRRTGKGIFLLDLVRLCQRLTSSPLALAHSLDRLAGGDLVAPAFRSAARELAGRARAVQRHAKVDALASILNQYDDALIVFSEHLPTLRLVARTVEAHGRPAITFQGGLSLAERTRRLARFRRERRGVFIATRAGTEGLNLQFCNRMVNWELPWNPMVIEQRIGRIHRIGQTREAHIINFAAEGTIEAYVLRLLDEKIQLFRLVVGELDVILGEFGGADRLQDALRDAFFEAETDADFAHRVDRIGHSLEHSRAEGLRQEQRTSAIAPDDNAGRITNEFPLLSPAGRLRLAWGTRHLHVPAHLERLRHRLGLHINEILEALESATAAEPAGSSEFGPLLRVSGVTGRGRRVTLTAQADRLPMTLAALDADAEAPLPAPAAAP